MARKKREFTTFNLSFLDIMSCGFGAVVLVFLIIDHSIQTVTKDLNRDLLSEVSLLEEDVKDGDIGLVKLRNTLSEVDNQMVEAQGQASRITDDIDNYEALIADLRKDGFALIDKRLHGCFGCGLFGLRFSKARLHAGVIEFHGWRRSLL